MAEPDGICSKTAAPADAITSVTHAEGADTAGRTRFAWGAKFDVGRQQTRLAHSDHYSCSIILLRHGMRDPRSFHRPLTQRAPNNGNSIAGGTMIAEDDRRVNKAVPVAPSEERAAQN